MTGQELIDWIKNNHAEEYEICCYDHFGDGGYLFTPPEKDDIRKEIWIIA